MLLSKDWQDALDSGLDTFVVVLDITGIFDSVARWRTGKTTHQSHPETSGYADEQLPANYS